ncbi:MAG TPA: hypothetical protein VFC19_19835 [Candidatus Limnocylindrales bacterium]|nr:hypothetical protein [Candidatus Limnocylindrales bacterium]
MTRIRDAACDAILAALDPLPEAAPALIPYRPPLVPDRAADQDLLAQILHELESVALDLYPAWLPLAEGTESLTVQQIRSLAYEHAEAAGRFGPFLADLAEAAVTRQPVPRHRLPVTAAGIGYAIAQGHRRPSAVLLVDVPPRLTEHAETRLASALDCLAVLSGMGIWLTGAPLLTVTRHPTVAAPRT